MFKIVLEKTRICSSITGKRLFSMYVNNCGMQLHTSDIPYCVKCKFSELRCNYNEL